jgi:hypothetical protein
MFGRFHHPGCAARPWALECNAFGVKTQDFDSIPSKINNQQSPFGSTMPG